MTHFQFIRFPIYQSVTVLVATLAWAGIAGKLAAHGSGSTDGHDDWVVSTLEKGGLDSYAINLQPNQWITYLTAGGSLSWPRSADHHWHFCLCSPDKHFFADCSSKIHPVLS